VYRPGIAQVYPEGPHGGAAERKPDPRAEPALEGQGFEMPVVISGATYLWHRHPDATP
jgi:hypothetical protein